MARLGSYNAGARDEGSEGTRDEEERTEEGMVDDFNEFETEERERSVDRSSTSLSFRIPSNLLFSEELTCSEFMLCFISDPSISFCLMLSKPSTLPFFNCFKTLVNLP
jgi:hypothetical protein